MKAKKLTKQRVRDLDHGETAQKHDVSGDEHMQAYKAPSPPMRKITQTATVQTVRGIIKVAPSFC